MDLVNHRSANLICDEDLQGRLRDAILQTGVLNTAAQSVGLSEKDINWACERSAEVAYLISDSMERATDRAEMEARRRAIDGYDDPVFQGGELIGFRRRYSDDLLKMILKGRRRDVYGDHQTIDSRNLNVNINDPTERAERLNRILESARERAKPVLDVDEFF